MKEKQIKLPGPDHPISIERNPARVVVSVPGRVVADTHNALTLPRRALPQKSISVVTSFVFSSCDFVDRSFCEET